MREAGLHNSLRGFARRVGVSDAVASARLTALVEAGLLERSPYQEPGQRSRHEYRLTEMGTDLVPVLLGLTQWEADAVGS